MPSYDQFKESLLGLRDAIEVFKKSNKRSSNKDREYQERLIKEVNGKNKIYIDVTAMTVIKVTALVILSIILAQFVTEIVDILLLLFISIILSSAITPIVDRLHQRKIPRPLTILAIYFVFFALFALIISSFIPFISEQISQLARYINGLIYEISTKGLSSIPFAERLSPILERIDQDQLLIQIQNALEGLSSQLQNISGGVFSIAASVFGGIFSLITVLVITFYLVLETHALEGFFKNIIPVQYEGWVIRHARQINDKLGAWVRGQLALCASIGVCVFIGLVIIGVPYAHTLALLAAILEIIPYVGPILAAIFAVFIALTVSPWLTLFTILLFWIIQVLENNILVPIIMQKAVGLSPIVIILALLIGGKLLGVYGVVLSIPFVTALSVFTTEYARSGEVKKRELLKEARIKKRSARSKRRSKA